MTRKNRLRLPNKTQWTLTDIISLSEGIQEILQEIINQVDDVMLLKNLMDIKDNVNLIEHKARTNMQGDYE